jgi:hypothetical protein
MPAELQSQANIAFYMQAARVSTGDVVLVDPFQLPRSGFEITLLKADLGTLAKRRPGAPLEELDSTQITTHFVSRFRGQVPPHRLNLMPIWDVILSSSGNTPSCLGRCHVLAFYDGAAAYMAVMIHAWYLQYICFCPDAACS